MTLHRSAVGLLIFSFALWTHASEVMKAIPLASEVMKAIPLNASSQLAMPELAPVAKSVAPVLMSQVRSCPQGRGRCGR
jgi:hypothetical protein